MARYLASIVVTRGWFRRCLIQRAYDIGVAEPVSILVNAGSASTTRSAELAQSLRDEYDLAPADIIRQLNLKRPIYLQTVAYGHFVQSDLALAWEDM